MRTIHPKTLQQLRPWFEAGDKVAAYQNQAMDHSQFGHWQFLRIGPGCTYYRDVPKRLPDMGGQINWPYMLDKVFDSEEALLEFFTVEKVS